MKITDLKLDRRIEKALIEQGYVNASLIQEKTIPLIKSGKDIFGCAQTGSGKTCAFVTPIIEKIINEPFHKGIKSLILTPTRELAVQIYENIVEYGKYTNIKTLAIFGGVGEGMQKEKIRSGVDILVATPGRLLDFLGQRVIDISKITTFVLDEADRMLDMGFIVDVRKILKVIPTNRQTLMFSATLPDTIKELCGEMLTNPEYVSVNPPASTVDTVKQEIYYVDKDKKINLLIELMKDNSIYNALVFSRTKHGADKIAKKLTEANIKCGSIHGNKSQTARQLALNNFKDGKIRVLVATDIAARGIDIEYLSHVINFDLPDVPETYVHRIGRTARAGKSGIAISFCSIDEKDMVREIEKTSHITITEIKDHEFPMQVFTKTKKETPKPRNRNNIKTVSMDRRDRTDIRNRRDIKDTTDRRDRRDRTDIRNRTDRKDRTDIKDGKYKTDRIEKSTQNKLTESFNENYDNSFRKKKNYKSDNHFTKNNSSIKTRHVNDSPYFKRVSN